MSVPTRYEVKICRKIEITIIESGVITSRSLTRFEWKQFGILEKSGCPGDLEVVADLVAHAGWTVLHTINTVCRDTKYEQLQQRHLGINWYVCLYQLCLGGYTTGPKQLVQMLRQKSRPYLFSNTLPPPVVGGASKVKWVCRIILKLVDYCGMKFFAG